jgi:hypothetical protein
MQESSAITPSGERPDALQPWQLFTLAGLIGATIVVFMSRGQTPAGIILLSLIIFAAAYVGLAALRTFLPLAGVIIESTAEVLGGRTRAALEREKALVLRSIKELEFDRGMGKVSERDFAEMSARLRARASRLMRQLDAGSVYREQIEREVERRLRDSSSGTRDLASTARGAGSGTRASQDSRNAEFPLIHRDPGAGASASLETDPGSSASPIPSPASRAAACPSCDTFNDPDAKFCKNCGTRMEGTR